MKLEASSSIETSYDNNGKKLTGTHELEIECDEEKKEIVGQ